MNVTLELQASVFVQRPIEDVFDYVSDFNKAKDWRAEVVESSMSTPQMQWGTRLREVAVVLGRRVETISYVVDVESPHRWTFAHVSGPLPVSGSYDLVSKSANGTEFTYRISVGIPGIWALAAPSFDGRADICCGPRLMDSVATSSHPTPCEAAVRAGAYAAARDNLDASAPPRSSRS